MRRASPLAFPDLAESKQGVSAGFAFGALKGPWPIAINPEAEEE